MQHQASSSPFAGHEQLWMLALGALMLFGIYRRFRRNFGRQPLRPVRMGLRIGLLAVIGVALLPLALRSLEFMGVIAAGVAIGLGLGIFAASRTRFETHANAVHYIPHTYTGIAVFALFLGRMIYRLDQLYLGGGSPGGAGAGPSATGFAPQPAAMSPLTLGLLFVLISYNVYYSGRVLWKSRHIKPEDLETASIPN
jgi:hypothetical protein